MDARQYADHVALDYPVVWIGDVPWRAANRMLQPLAMPHTIKPVGRAAVRQALRQTKAAVARWNDAWDTAPCEWWWICCDDHRYDVESLSSSARRDIRAGLRRCEVRRVEPAWLAENGYETYVGAYRRYGPGASPVSRDQFAKGMLKSTQPGSEWWAALVDGTVASFARCQVLDNAVDLSWLKSDPKYHKALPNNALVYVLTREYMVDRRFLYVTDGSRVLGHETNVQDFLEKMGYRRIYCPLRVELSPLAAAAVWSRVNRWGTYLGLRRLARRHMEAMDAVASLVRIARSCPQESPTGLGSARGDTGAA
jgi:hypothetical protein